MEGRHKGADCKEVEKKWQATKEYFLDYKRFTRPFSVNLETAVRGFDIDNIAAQKHMMSPKLSMHVDGRPRKAPTWMVAWVAKTLCCLVDICKLVITFVTMVISLVTMAINKASWTFHGVLHAKVRHALR